MQLQVEDSTKVSGLQAQLPVKVVELNEMRGARTHATKEMVAMARVRLVFRAKFIAELVAGRPRGAVMRDIVESVCICYSNSTRTHVTSYCNR